jgi:uncharacterized protein
MKITTTSISISLLLLLIIGSINGQDKPPVIEVTGTANIKVVPDLMNWTVDINVEMDNVSDAKTKHDAALKNVLEMVKENGVPSNEIQTSGIRVAKNLDQYGIVNQYGTKKMKYTVSSSVWFSITDISNYDKLSEELIATDNVYITNTSLEYSKAPETRVLARTDALNAAKKKALEMAAVFEQTIGKPLQIQEDSNVYYPNPFNASTDFSSGNYQNSGSLFSQGIINISAKVKVVFELLSK